MKRRITQLADYCAATIHPAAGPAICKAYTAGKMAAVWDVLGVRLTAAQLAQVRAEYRRINRATHEHYQTRMAEAVAAARAKG